jgi:hypothetical protein
MSTDLMDPCRAPWRQLPHAAQYINIVGAAEYIAATIAGCGPPLNSGAQAVPLLATLAVTIDMRAGIG